MAAKSKHNTISTTLILMIFTTKPDYIMPSIPSPDFHIIFLKTQPLVILLCWGHWQDCNADLSYLATHQQILMSLKYLFIANMLWIKCISRLRFKYLLISATYLLVGPKHISCWGPRICKAAGFALGHNLAAIDRRHKTRQNESH